MSKTSQKNSGFDRMLVLRVTNDEYERMQSIAENMGVTLSKAMRVLLFQKSVTQSSEKFAASTEKHKASLLLHAYRTEFRDLSKSVTQMVSMYGRSLDSKDGKGRPVISTSQTIDLVRRCGATLMKMQQILNDIHEGLGAPQRVSDAIAVQTTDPLREKVIEEGGKEALPQRSGAPGDVLPAVTGGGVKEIPIKYRIMNQMNLYGKLARSAEMITDKNGVPFLHIVISCEPYAGGSRKEVLVDVIYPRASEKLAGILNEGVRVYVSGTFDTATFAYNGVKSGAAYTVRADNVSVGSTVGAVFAGTLTADASQFSSGQKEMMLLPLSVQLSAGRTPKYAVADAVMPFSKELLSYLRAGTAVTVVGVFDPETYEMNGSRTGADFTVWVNDLKLG